MWPKALRQTNGALVGPRGRFGQRGRGEVTLGRPAGGAATIVTVRVALESGPGVLRRAFAGGENRACARSPAPEA